MDMTSGIIDRFRAMAIAPASVLTGHALTGPIQAVTAPALLIKVASGLGLRGAPGLVERLEATDLLALFAFALISLAIALGLAEKSVENASSTPMFLILVPFVGSGFVRRATMPEGLGQLFEYEPFSFVTDSVQGLLTGAPVGAHAVVASAWSRGITTPSYPWATRLYNRRRAAKPT